MQEIKKDGILYAILIESKNLENGVKWYTGPDDTIQVCTRKYKGVRNKKLKCHFHEKIVREVLQTQECLVLIDGKLSVRFYDLKQNLFKEIDMKNHDVLIIFCGGHGFDLHSDRCVLYEVKAAKYVKDIVEIKPDIDKTLIS